MLWRIPADTHEQRIDRWPRPITGLTRNLIGMTNDQPSVRGFAVSPTGRSPRENERRKGRKGRKLPAAIRRVGFLNDINHLDVHCGGRFAPLAVAETGANRRKPPAETLIEKLAALSLSHFWGPLKSS